MVESAKVARGAIAYASKLLETEVSECRCTFIFKVVCVHTLCLELSAYCVIVDKVTAIPAGLSDA